jgi:hypothetical protein
MAFKSIFGKTFTYRNALTTDIRQTFERARREQRRQKGLAETGQAAHASKVVVRASRRSSATK